MINNFSLLEKSIFPTLLFEKMRYEINFHENRIFFNILYFCTKYAILVNLIKRHKKGNYIRIDTITENKSNYLLKTIETNSARINSLERQVSS